MTGAGLSNGKDIKVSPVTAFTIGVLFECAEAITNTFKLINPKVIEYGTNEKGKEGCLSFPGLFLNVDRPEWIVVEYTDENGTVNQTRLEGISARCFLHELDHLNGIKYTTLVKPLALKMARQKANKIVKKIVRGQKNGK